MHRRIVRWFKRRRYSADRVQTALRLRHHPWPSHSWQPPVAADFLSANLRPIRKVLTHLGEPLEPPPVSPARGPPTDWGELVQVHDDRAIFQGRIDELPDIDIHSL
jgi:hypothetical protein